MGRTAAYWLSASCEKTQLVQGLLGAQHSGTISLAVDYLCKMWLGAAQHTAQVRQGAPVCGEACS